MKPAFRSLVAIFASIILFAFWAITMNFRVETVMTNGLNEVSYPYSGVSLIAVFAAIGLLLFGITSAAVPLRGSKKTVLGSALLSGGILAVLFAFFWALSNYLDEQPRCSDFGCPSGTILYYDVVYVTSIVLAIAGIVAIEFSFRFFKQNPVQTGV